jgi:hypothetical protein
MNRALVAIGLVGVIAVSAAHAADKVELRWQFQKGQVLKYLIKHHEVRLTEVADQKFETATNTDSEWQWTVKDVDAAGTATIELKLTGLRVEATGKEFTFSYDSTKANEAEGKYNKDLKEFYDQMRFATYRMQLKADGRVGEVYGFDKLLSETTTGTQVAEFHGYWLHDDSFGWFHQTVLGVLPEKAVTRDATWKGPAPGKLKGLGEVSGQFDFTLDKPTKVGDRSLEQIKLAGSQTINLDMAFGSATMTGSLKSSKQSGTIRFDPKAGLVEGSDVTVDYAGELKFPTGGQPLILKVTLKNEVTVERKR